MVLWSLRAQSRRCSSIPMARLKPHLTHFDAECLREGSLFVMIEVAPKAMSPRECCQQSRKAWGSEICLWLLSCSQIQNRLRSLLSSSVQSSHHGQWSLGTFCSSASCRPRARGRTRTSLWPRGILGTDFHHWHFLNSNLDSKRIRSSSRPSSRACWAAAFESFAS